MTSGETEIKVADETFIAVALLHWEHPERADFTIGEIVERAREENLYGVLRPGVRVHATLHCVANRAPNPGRYRMLYATGEHTRRLLHAGDPVHPDRTGKIWPDLENVPERYRDLIQWTKRQYAETPPNERWLDSVFQLIGLGREVWRGEDPDEYVRKLREGWE
ncbi:MAG: hypothetical protein JO307_07665 [Bryobacterales bacterium]|nr:hypothetical protein [Bryobacterales bacterium]MBV9402065.1 hypothetical protein [Bryobacterales bacterium]